MRKLLVLVLLALFAATSTAYAAAKPAKSYATCKEQKGKVKAKRCVHPVKAPKKKSK